jgi:hypothetical protein
LCTLDVYDFGQPPELFVGHPFSLEIVADSLLMQTETSCFFDGSPIRFDFCWSLNVFEIVIKELLAFHKLSNVDEFVDNVKVNVCSVALAQIVGADYHVTVDFAHSHVASSSNELHSQFRQHLIGVVSENPSYGPDSLETLEIIRKRIGCYWSFAAYVDV